MTIDIQDRAQQILDGVFLARSAYGGTSIAAAFNVKTDNARELADNYRGYLASQADGGWHLLDQGDLAGFDGKGFASFTTGGLYTAIVDYGSAATNDAQGLLAVEGDTLVLAFRGTDDKDPAVEDGQAFVGAALAANYEAFRPLLEAALRYLADHPEIAKVVVSGHSLGGALVDVFALTDADDFRAARPGGLTMVSIGSSGLPKDIAQFLDGVDTATALTPPPDYIAIANGSDRVRYAVDYPDIPEAPGLVPVAPLKANLHFGGDLVFRNPNIDNTDVIYYNPLSRPFDFRGFGAEHNSNLYWANVEALLNDALLDEYRGQTIIVGLGDYRQTPDWDGDAVKLFDGYVNRSLPRNDWDRGDKTLTGTSGDDYILGLSGRDRLEGSTGDDVLSGGSGDDQLVGGLGHDVMAGGSGADRFYFSSVKQTKVGAARDVIADFVSAQHDVIDLSAIDAIKGGGDDSFTLIEGDFTAAGQIRVYQLDGQTIVEGETTGDGRADFQIALGPGLTLSIADFEL